MACYTLTNTHINCTFARLWRAGVYFTMCQKMNEISACFFFKFFFYYLQPIPIRWFTIRSHEENCEGVISNDTTCISLFVNRIEFNVNKVVFCYSVCIKIFFMYILVREFYMCVVFSVSKIQDRNKKRKKK